MHPKLAESIARTYVTKYRSVGPAHADAYTRTVLKNNPEDTEQVRKAIKKIAKETRRDG